MDTVTTTPAYGCVEYYARLIRPNVAQGVDAGAIALHLIDDLANHPIHAEDGGDGNRLDRIRNVLAAAKLLRTGVDR